jgi:ABC-type thiamine transport system substrate-binding protein
MKRFFFLTFLVTIVLAGCAPKGPVTLNVMTHDSFAASASVVTALKRPIMSRLFS